MQSKNDPQIAPINWQMLIIFWAIIAAIYLTRTWILRETLVLFVDTDDAMRMVTVRDLLAGQSWTDNIQYRANTPLGHEMHWSRLIDAPLALILTALKPLFGANAYLVTAAIWPLMLMFVLFYLGTRLTIGLLGRQAQIAALVLPLISMALLPEFIPGRIDHHNVQILLAVTMLICTIEAQTRTYAALAAGITCAISLAIGLEGLIFIALTVLSFGLFWTWYGAAWRGRLTQFALGFAAPTALIFFTLNPPANIFRPDCDALSITYLTLALGIGLTYCLCALLTAKLPSPTARFITIALGGLITVTGLALLFPQCLGGPYAALDAELQTIWIDNITEAKSILSALKSSPAQAIALLIGPIIGLGLTIRLAVKKRHIGWTLVALYLGTALLITLFQVRGIRIAAVFCIPAAAWLIGTARARYLATAKASTILGLLGAWLAFAGIAQFFVLTLALSPLTNATPAVSTNNKATLDKNACYLPDRFQKLAQLPATRLMAPIDLGAHILLFTPHSIVTAPYHRNQDGLHDTFDFFNKPQLRAKTIAKQRGLTHMVTCADLAYKSLTKDHDPQSLGAQMQRGLLPDWLEPLSKPDDDIKIYRITLSD